jgi:predicted MFS family arabinose efflux permease
LDAKTRLTIRLGITQIISWGSGFYIPAVLAVPIAASLGISTETFFWAFTFSLLVSGLIGPRIGKAIDKLGGRKVLPFGSVAFFLGLVLLATSREVNQLFVAWFLLGIGGSMGNYDAAFATAVSFFGNKSNQVIAGITVFAGFSSTISWPITTFLEQTYDWRAAIWFWAALHIIVCLPLYLTIPRIEKRDIPDMTGPIRKLVRNKFRFDPLLAVFGLMFALQAFIVSSVNTTLPFMLSELGADVQLALLASVLLGPFQVLARVLLVALTDKATPITVAAISIAAHPLGVVFIWILGPAGILPFVMLHGIGVGLNPFIRGSLPLLFFGSDRFGQRQGYIMMPSKILGALSPTLLTLMLLASPQLAILGTFFMGFVSGLLLFWVYLIYKARNPRHPETGEFREIS